MVEAAALMATFWRDTLERAVKTAAQGALAAAGAVQWTSVGEVVTTAQAVGYAAAAGALLSILTSLASLPIGDTGTPSLVSAVAPAVEAVPEWLTDDEPAEAAADPGDAVAEPDED